MPSAPDCVRPSQTRTKAQALPHVPSEGPRLQQCRVQRTANGMPVLSPRGSSQGALPRLHQVYTDREQQKNDRPSRAPATKSHGGNPASRPETGRCHPRKRGTKKEKGSGPRGSGPGAGRQFNAWESTALSTPNAQPGLATHEAAASTEESAVGLKEPSNQTTTVPDTSPGQRSISLRRRTLQ